VAEGRPSRRLDELFRPNLKKTDYITSPSNMKNATVFAIYDGSESYFQEFPSVSAGKMEIRSENSEFRSQNWQNFSIGSAVWLETAAA
jgi:hypothetical protein